MSSYLQEWLETGPGVAQVDKVSLPAGHHSCYSQYFFIWESLWIQPKRLMGIWFSHNSKVPHSMSPYVLYAISGDNQRLWGHKDQASFFPFQDFGGRKDYMLPWRTSPMPRICLSKRAERHSRRWGGWHPFVCQWPWAPFNCRLRTGALRIDRKHIPVFPMGIAVSSALEFLEVSRERDLICCHDSTNKLCS